MLVALIITLCRFAMFDKPTTNIISFSPHSIYTCLLWRKLSHFFVSPSILSLCGFWTHFNGCARRHVFRRCFWKPEWGGQLHLSASSGQHAICSHARQDRVTAPKGAKEEGCARFSLPILFLHIVSLLSSRTALQPAIPLKISPHLPSLSVIWRTNSLIPAQICWSLNKRSAQATTRTWTKRTIKKKENTSRYVLRNIVLREYTSLF